MRAGMYPKLALDGIRRNRQLYFPYLLTCIGMVMMQYIIVFLSDNAAVKTLHGGDTIAEMMEFGGFVMALFSAIFLFYTNSFLIRRRKKEFGLYNILGMGKGHIARILFLETVFVLLVSLAAGLLFGMAFSKIAELGIVKMMRGTADFSLGISAKAVFFVLQTFCVVFMLIYLNAVRQVKFSDTAQLLKSENVGEKPPKANWFLGVAGIAVLAAGYTIALLVKNPIAAFSYFFVAVLLVIVGTYMTMISGSVLLCRILQKKKNYYYKANHFVSVSSMAYRMKRNGAGLASICVLATMVLVILSTTTSLMFGSEDALNARYPRDINMDYRMKDAHAMSDANIGEMRREQDEILGKRKAEKNRPFDWRSASVTGVIDGKKIVFDPQVYASAGGFFGAANQLVSFIFVPIDDYNRQMNRDETLNAGEVLIYPFRIEWNAKELYLTENDALSIKKQVDSFVRGGMVGGNTTPTVFVFVHDFADLKPIENLTDSTGERMLIFDWYRNFDTGLTTEENAALVTELADGFSDQDTQNEWGISAFYIDERESQRADYFGTFGGIFYLGIALSIVFLFAAVLIIYYKQISEGFEDRSRFDIMQKVGMTKKEIRGSINAQLLTVFYLPLLGAGLHLCFAFPMMRKLLQLFYLNNIRLFAGTTLLCFVGFGILYMLVYRITANAYYRIVSTNKK